MCTLAFPFLEVCSEAVKDQSRKQLASLCGGMLSVSVSSRAPALLATATGFLAKGGSASWPENFLHEATT